jgi:hypothetical protein
MFCSRIEAVRVYTDVLGLWKKMTEIPVRRGWWLRVVSPEVTGRHRASPRTVHLPAVELSRTLWYACRVLRSASLGSTRFGPGRRRLLRWHCCVG